MRKSWLDHWVQWSKSQLAAAAQLAKRVLEVARNAQSGATRLFSLIAILALSTVVFSVAASAADAPPEDRGWGTADYETDKTRYQARVQFYEDEAAKLEGRRQQIAADLNLFWHTWSAEARDGFIDQFDRSFDGIQYQSRVDERKEDENNARGLFLDFETNCARCDEHKPDVRERAYGKHLDYLRARNARMAAYNKYLDLRQQRIKTNTKFAFEEWMRDNIDDVSYVTERVAGAIADDFYKACVGGSILKVLSDAASLKLTGKAMATPGSLLINCAQDIGFGILANATLFALQKQFIDDMVRRGIHKEVAEYWMFEILTPKGASKLTGATSIAQTSAKLLAREVKAQYKHQLGVGIRSGLRAKFFENPWTVGAKPTTDAGLLKIRDEAIDKLAKQKQQEILKSKKIQLRMQAYKAGKLVAKYVERVFPLVAAYYDFPDLERLEVPKYWAIRRCLEARHMARTGNDIVAVLKLPPPDYRNFKRECREQEQAGCPANIENARALIEEAARTRANLNSEAGAARSAPIDERIRALENELQIISDKVNRAAVENADVCSKLKTEQQTLNQLIDRVRKDAGKAATLRDTVRRHAKQACAADEVAAAENEARQATDAASESKRIAGAIAHAHAGIRSEFGTAGETIDMAPAEAEASGIAAAIEDLKSVAVAADQRRDAMVARLDGGARTIEVCTKRADREVRRLLENERQSLLATTFSDPDRFAALTGGVKNAETWIGEMKAQQDTSLACFKALPDPKGIIAEIGSWNDAVGLLVNAALNTAKRANHCVEEAKAREADFAAAKSTLDACEFKASRKQIKDLPEGPRRTALVAQWNKAYETERKAHALVKEAMALKDHGEPKKAIGKLQAARDLKPCNRTVTTINKAVANIQSGIAAGNAEAALAACRFKESHKIIQSLPDGARRQALVARWNKAYQTERRARDLIKKAMELKGQGQLSKAIRKLRVARGLQPCDSTATAIDTAVANMQGLMNEADAMQSGGQSQPAAPQPQGCRVVRVRHGDPVYPSGGWKCICDSGEPTKEACCSAPGATRRYRKLNRCPG